jgi:hypothetical protein
MKRKKHFARPNFFSRKYAMLGRIAKQTRLLRDIRLFALALTPGELDTAGTPFEGAGKGGVA